MACGCDMVMGMLSVWRLLKAGPLATVDAGLMPPDVGVEPCRAEPSDAVT